MIVHDPLARTQSGEASPCGDDGMGDSPRKNFSIVVERV
jgi:hypothetical protein